MTLEAHPTESKDLGEQTPDRIEGRRIQKNVPVLQENRILGLRLSQTAHSLSSANEVDKNRQNDLA